MDRRTFIIASTGLLGACRKPWFLAEVAPPVIERPGMVEGHWLRDGGTLPAPTEDIETDIAILGSGIAGLSCAWKLSREGRRGVLLVNGPEPDGNATASSLMGVAAPRGAHYLPLPSMESTHVREMLHDFGIIEADPFATHPKYDESALVHAPVERMLVNDNWQDSLLPDHHNPAWQAQHQRFTFEMERFGQAHGQDGKKAFAIPRMLSSRDPAFTGLDAISMKAWLLSQDYDAPSLHWYCDYACRDDYGTSSEQTSAWAGIHYFAARVGQAANAAHGAVLTWPEGLAHIAHKLRHAPHTHSFRVIEGMATKVKRTRQGSESWVFHAGRCIRIRARQTVLAMPLLVTARILEGAQEFGLDKNRPPNYSPWLVGNVCLEGFPRELPGSPLAWDNVIYGSKSQGYVVATHQSLHRARASHTVFTTWHALCDQPMADARRWLASASPEELLDVALGDLRRAYPRRLDQHIRMIELVLRPHAMRAPQPGFLSDGTQSALREGAEGLHFAHADLSGMSLFEEASWWGVQAAQRLLGFLN